MISVWQVILLCFFLPFESEIATDEEVGFQWTLIAITLLAIVTSSAGGVLNLARLAERFFDYFEDEKTEQASADKSVRQGKVTDGSFAGLNQTGSPLKDFVAPDHPLEKPISPDESS